MVVYNNILAGASGATGAAAAYQIDRSLRFNRADSSYLNRTPSSESNRRTWTWSAWVKRSDLTNALQGLFGAGVDDYDYTGLYFQNDELKIEDYPGGGIVRTEPVLLRDASAWYHIVVAVNTTLSTAADRVKFYLNGDQLTTSGTWAQNTQTRINKTQIHKLGEYYPSGSSAFFTGYLAEVNFVDGQQLAASDFGEYDDNNVWQPKEYAGAYDQKSGGRTIANSSGALPILNTSGDDGEAATSGVRTDSNASSIVLALPLNGSNGGTTITDYHHTVKGSGSAKAISIYTGSASGGAVTSTAVSKYYGSSFYAVRGATNNYSASDYIHRTGDSDLDLGTGSFCVEFWYYPTAYTANSVIFDNRHQSNSWPNSSNGFSIVVTGNGSIFTYSGGNQIINHSTKLTLNAWNHIAYTRDGSTERLFVNGDFFSTTASSSRNYNEGRFHLGSAANNGEGSDGYYQDLRIYKGVAKYTSNFTVPVAGVGGVNSFFLKFADNSSNAALGTDSSGLSNTWTVNNLSHTEGRDYTGEGSTSGSFYDSAGGAASKMFDGDASTGAFSSSGTATFTFGGSTITASSSLKVRAFKGDSSGANVLVNGTNISSLLNAQSSGGYSTVDITSTLGGAPINLSNVSVVNASGGSGNIAQIFVDDVELVDGSASDNDSLIDTPTNYSVDSGNPGGNYCVMNPLLHVRLATLSNGNLDVTGGSYTDNGYGTIAVPSGKWYAEATVTGGGGASNIMLGVKDVDQTGSTDFGAVSRGYGYRNDAKRINSDLITASYGATYTVGDVIGIALDLDAGTITFYKNGSSQGQAYSGISSDYSYHFCSFTRTTSDKVSWNFGQRSFAYTPPSNHLAVCTTNLPDPTIADGSTAFDISLYDGNGGTQSITGLAFQPDLVWTKQRSGGEWNALIDVVRGGNLGLASNNTNADETRDDAISSFNSDGYTIGDWFALNQSSHTYVSWAWDAGTSTVSNTDGSITSSLRANPSAGFSIVSYAGNGTAGATVGHGLNAVPEWVVCKDRDDTDNWQIYHVGAQTSGAKLLKFTADSASSNNGPWNNTVPTNSVVTLGGGGTNDNNNDHIMYCWAPVEGYSAFGSYTGNGSTDGPFVFTGHRSQFLLVKQSSASGEDWWIVDTARETFNPQDQILLPNSNNSEITTSNPIIDILSNGFKIRNTNARFNGSGATYVFASFASHPFKTVRAR